MYANETPHRIGAESELPTAPATLDLEAVQYRAEFEVFGMTDTQQAELLETLWSVMRSFVEPLSGGAAGERPDHQGKHWRGA